jgi:small subunit ribosomal protein S2
MTTTVSVKKLLDAAVHFGHQTRRWNPKMKPYIFTSRNGIYILDLKRTLVELDRAYSFVRDLAARGGNLLFVGTKKQAQEPISSAAERCNMPYVNNRWLGGMLTNFSTIRSRVTRMEELEAMDEDGRMASLPKKEQIGLHKELEKLRANLNGMRNMLSVPQAIFVVDTIRESNAIREAKILGIPVIGILDTNANPDDVEFGIPGNDDAIRAVSLISDVIADAVVSGMSGSMVSEAEMLAADAVLAENVQKAQDAYVSSELDLNTSKLAEETSGSIASVSTTDVSEDAKDDAAVGVSEDAKDDAVQAYDLVDASETADEANATDNL